MFVAPEIIPLEAVSKSAAAVQAAAGASLEGVAYLDTADVLRWRGAEDVRTVQSIRANLPQLPDTEVDEIYERIVAAEAQIVGAGRTLATYDEGTAQVDDELLVATFPGAVLLEAQHATDPVRKSDGLRGGADHGTGGLGLVLAQDVGGRIIIPRGRQMGNANVSPEHPVKDALLQSAAGGTYERFFSVHGCAPSKVTSPLDEVEVHAIIGLGLNPGEADFERAETLRKRAAQELGLRVITGNVQPHVDYAKNPEWDGHSFRDATQRLATDTQGQVVAKRVAAMMANSTTTVMRERTSLPSNQLEISRSLRLLPTDTYRRPDPSAEKYGVYMGYQLCRLATEV